MNNHLSQDQISMAILGRSTAEELRHGRECPQCRAELARFEAPVSAFRSVMLEWSESAPRMEESAALVRRPAAFLKTSWRWVAAGVAAVLLTTVPIYKQQQALMQRAETAWEFSPASANGNTVEPNADSLLMEAVNTHLSRTIPEPMEPIMALIRKAPSTAPSGGNQ